MPSKSVLRRKVASSSSISVPDPRAYRAILATHDKRVRWLEETSIREMFSHSPALHDLESDTSEAARVLSAQYAAQRKVREAEERKAKLAAAKQPLPKGYVVEKGRGGYHFTTPTGEIHPRGRYGLKTKGEAVTAAIAHHQNQRSR